MTAKDESLEYGTFGPTLDLALEGIALGVERNWPRSAPLDTPYVRETALIHFRAAMNTYGAIRYLCADEPPDPSRKPWYVLAVAPMSRTILDSIFTLLFILEDPPERMSWYNKSGWRSLREELDRHELQYGTNPEWSAWLAGVKKALQDGVGLLSITPSEEATPSQIPRWPNPGSMVEYGLKKNARRPPTRDFLRYLNDWFYRDQSGHAHLSGEGAAKLGIFHLRQTFLHDVRDRIEEEILPQFRANQIGRSIVLICSLASELEHIGKFGFAEKLKYVWTLAGSYSPEFKEIYQIRYAALL